MLSERIQGWDLLANRDRRVDLGVVFRPADKPVDVFRRWFAAQMEISAEDQSPLGASGHDRQLESGFGHRIKPSECVDTANAKALAVGGQRLTDWGQRRKQPMRECCASKFSSRLARD